MIPKAFKCEANIKKTHTSQPWLFIRFTIVIITWRNIIHWDTFTLHYSRSGWRQWLLTAFIRGKRTYPAKKLNCGRRHSQTCPGSTASSESGVAEQLLDPLQTHGTARRVTTRDGSRRMIAGYCHENMGDTYQRLHDIVYCVHCYDRLIIRARTQRLSSWKDWAREIRRHLAQPSSLLSMGVAQKTRVP